MIHSIFISLLNQNMEESKFWIYELYFSGFKHEAFILVWKLYYQLYAGFYPNLETFIQRQTNQWIQYPINDWIIGTIIENMARREPCINIYQIIHLDKNELLHHPLYNIFHPYMIQLKQITSITEFEEWIETLENTHIKTLPLSIQEKWGQIYLSMLESMKVMETLHQQPISGEKSDIGHGDSDIDNKIEHSMLSSSMYISRFFTYMLFFRNYSIENTRFDPKHYSILSKNDILHYFTKPFVQSKGWKKPTGVCVYPIHILPNSIPLTIEHYHDWLFYASFSPIWEKRIKKYGGKIESIGKTILFENETQEEAFYQLYDLEPEEQSLETQHKWLGNTDTNNNIQDMNELYQKYNCNIFIEWVTETMID